MRPFDQIMRDELIRVGFDFDRPDPEIAWRAFKSFVGRSIPAHKTITVGFSCEHVEDRDETLWLEFARQLQDEAGTGQKCGCGFSRPVTPRFIGVARGNWWWPEHGTLDGWFREVEAMPEFAGCLALPGWRFVGYSL